LAKGGLEKGKGSLQFCQGLEPIPLGEGMSRAGPGTAADLEGFGRRGARNTFGEPGEDAQAGLIKCGGIRPLEAHRRPCLGLRRKRLEGVERQLPALGPGRPVPRIHQRQQASGRGGHQRQQLLLLPSHHQPQPRGLGPDRIHLAGLLKGVEESLQRGGHCGPIRARRRKGRLQVQVLRPGASIGGFQALQRG